MSWAQAWGRAEAPVVAGIACAKALWQYRERGAGLDREQLGMRGGWRVQEPDHGDTGEPPKCFW